MERFEKKIKNEMKESENITYPDFDQMWSDIQQDKLKTNGGKPVVIVPRKRKRFALIAGLSVALLATPVYGALTYDWSNILSYREGIQSALDQGLGQTIEQSVTKDNITLTVHTAFIDDNRTFLLYSLKPDASWNGKDIRFEQIGIKDQNGDLIEGNYVHQWNDELGVFQGYFETDWIVKGLGANVEFVMEDIQFIGDVKKPIDYDPNNLHTQAFPIQQDGIDSVTVQAFEQPREKTLIQSSIMYSDAKMASNSWARIEVIDGMHQPINEAESSRFGTPGPAGDYLNQQIFKTDSLQAENTKFQLTYTHTLGTVNGTWNLKMDLTKKQLKNASYKDVLNIDLPNVPGGTKIHELIVTPTQVRIILTHEEKYTRFPYQKYQLDIGGTLLKGGMWILDDPYKTELRFETTGMNVHDLANQPVTLIAKHRVDIADGDNKPIKLTGISAKPQSLTTHIKGFPISWTYYMKDNNLYVESVSSDRNFGGVNQTYYLDNKDRNYGMPVIMGVLGDENNQHIDVYENFKKSKLDIYIWNYTTHKRDDVLRVPLKLGN